MKGDPNAKNRYTHQSPHRPIRRRYQRVHPSKSFRDRRDTARTHQTHPGNRRRRIDLQLRKVLCQRKKGAERQEPGHWRGPDAGAKKEGHVPELKETEGEIERLKIKIAITSHFLT